MNQEEIEIKGCIRLYELQSLLLDCSHGRSFFCFSLNPYERFYEFGMVPLSLKLRWWGELLDFHSDEMYMMIKDKKTKETG
jgi:hypothetical protein